MTRIALPLAAALALAIAGCNRPLPPHVNPPDVKPAAPAAAPAPAQERPAASPARPAP
ncbi:MAG: hypothetical protein JSR86_10245 [Proteobacteria bacterium]|nr:hypothetical protein [Pseudomonadota bacterium]